MIYRIYHMMAVRFWRQFERFWGFIAHDHFWVTLFVVWFFFVVMIAIS